MRRTATYRMGVFLALIPFGSQADVLVSLDASAQINGTDFSTHYGGGISTGNNVAFSGSPAITNGQVAGATTYNRRGVHCAGAIRGSSRGQFLHFRGVHEFSNRCAGRESRHQLFHRGAVGELVQP